MFRYDILKFLFRNSGNETYISKARSLQLQFLHTLSLPVLTGTKIRGEKSSSVGIALYDVLTGQMVDSGPEASAKVEIVVLEKDFTGYEGANWSLEEFNSKIVREREGGKTLLTGDVHVNLKEGIGFIGDVYFRHTKCWMKRTEFRLGARTVDGALGLTVREAKTEPFIVEDRRAKCEYFLIYVVSVFCISSFNGDSFSSIVCVEVDYARGGKRSRNLFQ